MAKKTKIVTKGRNSKLHAGCVNPPIYQTSTVLFPDLASYHSAENGVRFYKETENGNAADYSYGIYGTPTTFALQDVLCELEGGDACVITSSGLSAITTTLLALLKSGDHILMVDTVYGPTRRFCNKELKKYGIETTYYDPTIGADIKNLIQKNTKMIFLESPGSLTFEIQDVPAIVKIAKENDIITVLDNSWATPLYFNPLKLGVDVSIQAVTKYIGGHSDLLLGAIITKGEAVTKRLFKSAQNLGVAASPYDCSLALRGIRSMAARMEMHQKNTNVVINAIKDNPKISKILYPAYEGDDFHELWKSQFKGAASLFSVVLDRKYSDAELANMIDNMELFGIGASWGGYESLVLNFDPSSIRTATKWTETASCVRFYIGLEDTEDLISDIKKALDRL